MDSMGDGAAAETEEYGLGNPIENVNVFGFEIHKKESYRKWSWKSHRERQCRCNPIQNVNVENGVINSYRERQCPWNRKSQRRFHIGNGVLNPIENVNVPGHACLMKAKDGKKPE